MKSFDESFMPPVLETGKGADGENVSLMCVDQKWLVHCEGNSQSPFEFELEKDARQFMFFIACQGRNEL